jgi:uncharacterized protein (DUF362 family)
MASSASLLAGAQFIPFSVIPANPGSKSGAGAGIQDSDLSASNPAGGPLVSLVSGPDSRKALRAALEILGTMKSFISKGDRVLVKPNMSWDRAPEQAANTNPDLVSETVKMCFEAGAKSVKVLDRTCNNATRCYDRSGVARAAREAGADVSFVSESRFEEVAIPQGSVLKSWPVYGEALDADRIVNLPVLKHHSMAILTMGMKNLMGFLGGDRGQIHREFHEKIVDVGTIIKPALTILDATRVLTRNGPQGGSLEDVTRFDTVIAGADIVAVDAVGASLVEKDARELPYLQRAAERGLGEHDLGKIRIERQKLSP